MRCRAQLENCLWGPLTYKKESVGPNEKIIGGA